VTQEQSSIFSKLSVAYVVNTVLVPLLMSVYHSGSTPEQGNVHVIDQPWYEEGGVVQSAFVLLVLNWATDIMKAIQPAVLFRRYCITRFAFSQEKLLNVYAPPPFNLGLLYSQTVKTASLGLIFGSIYPMAYAITSAGLLLSWFCTRIGIRLWFQKPPTVDQEMMMELRLRLGNVMGVATVVQWAATWNALGSGGYGASSIVLAGGPLCCIVYALIPLGRFRMFAKAEQLGGDDDVEDDSDTGGLAFDEVARTTGNDMPRYVCPMLDTTSLAPPGEDKGCGMPDGHMDINKASEDNEVVRSK